MLHCTVFRICLVRLLGYCCSAGGSCVGLDILHFDCCSGGFVDVLQFDVLSISIGIMSMFFVVFAVHVAFLVTSLCAGVASVEAGIA
jgi:hypothetical protein